jgi:hypothetical protein
MKGFHPDLEKVLLAQIAYDSFEQDQLFFLKTILSIASVISWLTRWMHPIS